MTLVHFATTIDEDIMRRFRHVVYVKYGLKKGDISKALTEAVIDYIGKNSENNGNDNFTNEDNNQQPVLSNRTVSRKRQK
jgi:hypothetical protein